LNSRDKGGRGEREGSAIWASLWGVFARRGQQRSGSPDSPDIIHGMDGVHIEVKRCERGNPYDWITQAVRDAGDNIPVVMHKRNHRPWLLIVRLEDAPRFVMAAGLSPTVQAMGVQGVPAGVPCEGVCSTVEGNG
jgi:hypothetical protein